MQKGLSKQLLIYFKKTIINIELSKQYFFHNICFHKYVHDGITAAVFNLGFLPNQNDHAVITHPDTTVQALQETLKLLKPGGMITIAVYDGHPGGPEERDAVVGFVQQLDSKRYQVVRHEVVNQQNHPPFLLIIEKTSRGI